MRPSCRRLTRPTIFCAVGLVVLAGAAIAFSRGAAGTPSGTSHTTTPNAGIHYTVQTGDLASVKALLQANPALVSDRDGKYGASPLLVAAANGHKDIAELLLADKADVKAQNKNGATALHQATMLGHKDLVELLLAHGATVNTRDKDGFTALHYAAVKDNAEIAELLLAHQADVNAKDKDGATPLHCAAGRGFKDLAELLLAHQADINARDARGMTPLDWAMAYRRKELIEWLLAHKGESGDKDKLGGERGRARATTRPSPLPGSAERWRQRGVSIGGTGLGDDLNNFAPVMLPRVPPLDSRTVDATVWGQDTPNPFTNITPDGKAMLEARCIDIDKLAKYKAVLITGSYTGANRRDFVNTHADVVLVFGEGFITHGTVVSAGPVLALSNAHFMGNITGQGLVWFVDKSFPRGETLGAPIIIAPTVQRSQIKLPGGKAWFGDYGWRMPGGK